MEQNFHGIYLHDVAVLLSMFYQFFKAFFYSGGNQLENVQDGFNQML